MTQPPHRRNRVLLWIAIFKFFKTALFIGVALGTLEMLRPSFALRVQAWVNDLPFAMEQQVAGRFLVRIFRLSTGGIVAIAVAALLYAGLFLTEGIGLAMERRWAEWLTVVATASLIPFEIFESVHHVTIVRVAALIINVVVLWYLIIQLRRHPHIDRFSPNDVSHRISQQSSGRLSGSD
ncbi:MAG: DUF2127 domain-containing protein [Gemmatimonadota bacterium]